MVDVCHECGTPRPRNRKRCPQCGAIASFAPDEDCIQKRCEEINSGWTPSQENARRPTAYQTKRVDYSFPNIHQIRNERPQRPSE